MGDKFIWFNGLKYTRDENTNYYLNSTKRKRLHRAIWEYYNGEIPNGYHIHHKDHNKLNNNIENLELLPGKKHIKYHSRDNISKNYERVIENLKNNAQPKAAEWHGSADGKEWHEKQYMNYLGKWMEEKVTKVCEQCKRDFETVDTKTIRFCSNKCKSKWRRESGVDDELRKCNCCGKMFTSNKYSKTKFCSRSCSTQKYWKSRSS